MVNTPPDIGQQSLERLCAGHPLAIARLKQLMRDAERWRKLRASTGLDDDLPFLTVAARGYIRVRYTFERADEIVDAMPDKAIAEDGQ